MTLQQVIVHTAQASIMLTVLALGLSARWSDATYLFREPALLLRAVLSMNVVMPALAALLATTFDVAFEVKVAIVALAISPVPPLVQKKELTAGGRMEYVVGLLVAMAVLAVVVVPLSLWILAEIFDRAASVEPAAVAKIVLMTVLVPLAIGIALRRVWPAAEKAANAIAAVAGLLLLAVAVALVYGFWPVIRAFIGNGVVVMLVAIALIGLAVGHVLGGPLVPDRTTLAISTASRHPAVALTVATSGTVATTKAELAVILMYLIIATIVAIPYQKWRARSNVRAGAHSAT